MAWQNLPDRNIFELTYVEWIVEEEKWLNNNFRPGRSDSPVKRVSRLNQDGRLRNTPYLFFKKFNPELLKRIYKQGYISTDASHEVGRCRRALSLSQIRLRPHLQKQPNEVWIQRSPKIDQVILWHHFCSSYEQDCAGKEHSTKSEEHQVKSRLDDEHQLQGASRCSKNAQKHTFLAKAQLVTDHFLAWWGAGEDSEQSSSKTKAEDQVRRQRGGTPSKSNPGQQSLVRVIHSILSKSCP